MGDYDDIIHLHRPVSKRHLPMSALDRAAQFSPFAALTGHEEAIDETARLTDMEIELDADEREKLDQKLQWLEAHIQEIPVVTLTYFVPDSKKAGGMYRTVKEPVRKLLTYEREMVLQSGIAVSIERIVYLEIEGNHFYDIE